MISHCVVKGYGVQTIAIIDKLIEEGVCSFFVYDRENKFNVYAKTFPNGITSLTTDPNGSDRNGLGFLPLCDRPFLRQLIESIR
jgi:hypothetical protein